MPKTIADYGLLGDCESLALVTRGGAIEWLAWPRFDSPSCFAALLGTQEHGHWTVAPDKPARTTRRYRPDTLIIETSFETLDGVVTLVDFLATKEGAHSRLFRIVRGIRGRVKMQSELAPCFANGTAKAQIDADRSAIHAQGAGMGMRLQSSLKTDDFDNGKVAFEIAAGDEVVFVLAPQDARLLLAPLKAAHDAEQRTEAFWRNWTSTCTYEGPYRDMVVRSLITMKALIYKPSGGIIAAATTSLPESLGGKRNWDYRFCWLRDSTFTVLAMLYAGYREEAREWMKWLMQALDGKKARTQPLYGITYEKTLTESIADWLPGFAHSQPVRFGNDAFNQFQLDLYGEVFDSIHHMRQAGEELPENTWEIQCALIQQVCERWREPDAGIWEQRNNPEHFVQSRAMAWTALDCAIYSAEQFGLPGDVEAWKRTRAEIHKEVCDKGFDEKLGSFTRAYGTGTLDAALLLLPLIGFLPPDDPRILGTTKAVERDLMQDGFLLRYDLDKTDDGMKDKEGTFLACAFWLADNWILQGRRDEARELFERLLGAANDLGLLSEEYAPAEKMLLGNMPQALTHLSLVHTAYNLGGEGPAHSRSQKGNGRTDDAP